MNESGLGEENDTKFNKLKGLQGWLTLVGLGLFLSICIDAYVIVVLMSSTTTNGLISAIICAYLLYIAFTCYVTYLFVKQRKEFPNYFIGFLITTVVFSAGKSILGAILWIWYTKVSKRVKVTFIK